MKGQTPQDYIKEILKKAIKKEYEGLVLNSKIDVQEEPKFGDYSSILPFNLTGSGDNSKSPLEMAGKIKEDIERLKPEYLEKIEIAGNGFLNFFIKTDFFRGQQKTLDEQMDSISKFGKDNGESVIIVEFSSPNVAKPMHVGHLRNTILGNFIANLYEKTGHKVIRWDHIGDWGTQFGKLIVAYNKWGSKENIDKNPIKEMLALYIRFHKEAENNPEIEKEAKEEFKKLEDGDKKNLEILHWFLEESLKEFNKIYNKLISRPFDVIKGESEYTKDNKEIIDELKDKGLLKESDGALIIELGNNMPPALIQKNDGATLYFTREISSLKYRIKYLKEKYSDEKWTLPEIIYVVGEEQSLHFDQLKAVANKLKNGRVEGFDALPSIEHVKYGSVCGKDGKRFSTREGNLVTAESIIDDTRTEARKIVDEKRPELENKEREKISEEVGLGALKYTLLKDRKESNIIFDPERALSFKGNNFPYIQYTYARLKKILDEAGYSKFDKKHLEGAEESDKEIQKKLADLEEILFYKCLKDKTANHLTKYLFDLSEEANRFYEKTPILRDKNKKTKDAHLAISSEIIRTLKAGLEILGINIVDKI